MKRVICCEAYWDSSKLETCPRCSKRLAPAIHHVLAEQCDHSGLWSLRSFATQEDREDATRSLLGWDDEDQIKKVLDNLVENGIAEFEGDPPIRWMDATEFKAVPAKRENSDYPDTKPLIQP